MPFSFFLHFSLIYQRRKECLQFVSYLGNVKTN